MTAAKATDGAKAPSAARPLLPSRSVPASVMRMMAPRVAKPQATSSPSPSSPAAPAVPAAPAAPAASSVREFVVTVVTTPHKLLGVDVDWSDGKTLFVKGVQPGAVSDWNEGSGPDRAIKAGDRIIAVNGVSGSAEAIVRECKAQRELRLTIRTRRRPLAPALAAAEGGGAGAGGASPSSPSTKRPRLGAGGAPPTSASAALPSSLPLKSAGAGAGDLYSWMPAPDPVKGAGGGCRIDDEGPAVPERRSCVVFLDIDGVLRRLEEGLTISIDGETLPIGLEGQSRAFAPTALRALRHIVRRTGAGIVLSSEWRRSASLREEAATALRAVGLPALRGATPVLGAREDLASACAAAAAPAKPDAASVARLRWIERRAREISSWLREHPEVESWVALDDIDLGRADEVRLPDTLPMRRGLVLTSASEGLTMSGARKAVDSLLRKAPLAPPAAAQTKT